MFLVYDEQVPARWPNAQFSDETVFNRSYWAEGTLTGSNNAYTIGWLTDAGPEDGVHTGLNETINATGLDPVGAIAVMNLGSFRSNSRVITGWNPSNGTFAYDGAGVDWKTKHHAYFLEGKRELIDQDGEWWYNNTNNRLHYKTPSGQDANDLDLRVKVQPFAISVEGSDDVTIQGIDFFGTTVNFNNCDGCSLTNATLEYPSTSKRGLGIAGESEDDRWMTQESLEEDFGDVLEKTPEESEDDESEIESEDESNKESKKESENKSEKSSEKSQDEKAEEGSDEEKSSDTDEDSETKSDEESDEGSEDESKKSSKKGSKEESNKESKKPSSKEKTEESSEKAEDEEDSDEEKSSDTDEDSETKSDEESDEESEDESEEESEKETSEDESETEPSDKSEKSSEKSSKKKAKGEDGDSNKKKTSGSKKQSETKSEKKPKQNKKKSSKSEK